jgi:hypothetical protein
MRARNGRITVDVDTTVEIDVNDLVDDVIDQADEDTRAKLREALQLDRAPTGSPLDAIVERAYLAAREMANLPRELADLFWHVHGRAI